MRLIRDTVLILFVYFIIYAYSFSIRRRCHVTLCHVSNSLVGMQPPGAGCIKK